MQSLRPYDRTEAILTKSPISAPDIEQLLKDTRIAEHYFAVRKFIANQEAAIQAEIFRLTAESIHERNLFDQELDAEIRAQISKTRENLAELNKPQVLKPRSDSAKTTTQSNNQYLVELLKLVNIVQQINQQQQIIQNAQAQQQQIVATGQQRQTQAIDNLIVALADQGIELTEEEKENFNRPALTPEKESSLEVVVEARSYHQAAEAEKIAKERGVDVNQLPAEDLLQAALRAEENFNKIKAARKAMLITAIALTIGVKREKEKNPNASVRFSEVNDKVDAAEIQMASEGKEALRNVLEDTDTKYLAKEKEIKEAELKKIQYEKMAAEQIEKTEKARVANAASEYKPASQYVPKPKPSNSNKPKEVTVTQVAPNSVKVNLEGLTEEEKQKVVFNLIVNELNQSKQALENSIRKSLEKGRSINAAVNKVRETVAAIHSHADAQEREFIANLGYATEAAPKTNLRRSFGQG